MKFKIKQWRRDQENIPREVNSAEVDKVPVKLRWPWIQLIATIAASIAASGYGAGQAWTSAALPYLKSNNSRVSLTKSEGFWVASIFDLGSVSANLIAPMISEIFGRKYFLLLFTIQQAISLLLISLATNVHVLYISRFVGGVASHIALNFSMMYVGEIAEKTIRGKLLFLLKFSISLNFLTVKMAGAYLPYEIMNITMLCLLLPFFLLFPFIPESPYYLLLRKKRKQALKSLMRLREKSFPEMANVEIERIENAVKESQANKKFAFRELFCISVNRKSLFIVIIAMLTPYLTGRVIVSAYTQDIFDLIGFPLASAHCAIILGFGEFTMNALGILFIESAGRRKLYIFCCTFASVCLLITGLFFFVKLYLLKDVTSITWVPFVSLLLYSSSINLGPSPIAYLLLGEMFALNVKIVGISFTNVVTDFTVFSTKLVYQFFQKSEIYFLIFFIYASFGFIGTLLFFFFAPETKGKTLEEIQDMLHEKNKISGKSPDL